MVTRDIDDVLAEAEERWQEKGFSEATRKNLRRMKLLHRTPTKAEYRPANNDIIFHNRSKLDDVRDEIKTRQELKEVWDE